MQNKTDEIRNALITGASRGLGRATALRLAAAGYHLWLGVRNIEQGQSLLAEIRQSGGSADVMALDVTDANSIEAGVQVLSQHADKLSILVNNAGVMLDGAWNANSTLTVDARALRSTFDTNFFGVVALTRALWPLLQKAGNANVVNVSSIMGSNTLHADPQGPLTGYKPFAYDASKAALNSFTTHLAEVGRPHHIQVNSAHPGWVRTDMGTEYASLSIEQGIATIVQLAILPPSAGSGRFVHGTDTLPW